eukprot:GHVT01031408.1.p1 GENE.GHVT01031408.1~~GHVT01031408.1.p1  ORF type:complete len:257 (+),score=52.22 GHVT01031408.1:971-1741(+)
MAERSDTVCTSTSGLFPVCTSTSEPLLVCTPPSVSVDCACERSEAAPEASGCADTEDRLGPEGLGGQSAGQAQLPGESPWRRLRRSWPGKVDDDDGRPATGERQEGRSELNHKAQEYHRRQNEEKKKLKNEHVEEGMEKNPKEEADDLPGVEKEEETAEKEEEEEDDIILVSGFTRVPAVRRGRAFSAAEMARMEQNVQHGEKREARVNSRFLAFRDQAIENRNFDWTPYAKVPHAATRYAHTNAAPLLETLRLAH